MKISKKLAREILTGNFDNLPLDELQKDSRALSWAFSTLGYGWKYKPHWYWSKGLAKIDGI